MAFGASPLKASLKGRALRCLAQREHSRAELERKLARHAQDLARRGADADAGTGADADADAEAADAEPGLGAQIAAVLDELAAKGLLSDARTAEALLVSQSRRFGVRRLKQTLQAKGLDAELVAQTLQQARGTELERARDVWRRRFGAPAADATGRAKQMRFLAGRGFDGDVIRRVLQADDD